MGKSKRSTELDTITKRKPLEIAIDYQDTIGHGKYLQYRKPARGPGTWVVRVYDRDTRKITQARLGDADDLVPADDAGTLTYAQARTKAEKWILDRALAAARPEPPKEYLRTVRDVVENYIDTARKERKKAAKRTAAG